MPGMGDGLIYREPASDPLIERAAEFHRRPIGDRELHADDSRDPLPGQGGSDTGEWVERAGPAGVAGDEHHQPQLVMRCQHQRQVAGRLRQRVPMIAGQHQRPFPGGRVEPSVPDKMQHVPGTVICDRVAQRPPGLTGHPGQLDNASLL